MSRRPDPKSPAVPVAKSAQAVRLGVQGVGEAEALDAGRVRAPLPLSARMSDADWPGVVCQLGPTGRLSVSSDGRRYVVQTLAQTDQGPLWLSAGGRQPATLRKLLAKFGGQVEGLAEACEGLPDDPAEGQPVFAARLQAQAEHLAATDWARDSYAGEVARDGSLRIVVTPDRSAYRLQWIAKRDIGTGADWVTLRTASTLSEVWAFVREHVGSVIGPGRSGVLRGDAVEPRWRALVAGLPDSPAQAHVPALPAPRSTLQAPARNEVKGA